MVHYQGLVSACDRHSPDSWHGPTFGVIEVLTIDRFEPFETAVPRYLHRRATLHRNCPDLHATAACATEVDPMAISRPTGRNVFICIEGQAARSTTIGIDDVNG